MKTQEEIKTIFFELVEEINPKYKKHFEAVYKDFRFDGTETNQEMRQLIWDEISECQTDYAEYVSAKINHGNNW